MEIADIQRIGAESLQQRILSNMSIALVDILPEEQFLKNHIENAVNICVYDVIFMKRIEELFPDKNTMIVCYGFDSDDYDAAAAVEKLLLNNYRNSFVLEGGIVEWHKRGNSLEGTDGTLSISDELVCFDEGAYSVDVERSSLNWIGRNAKSEHTGSVKIKSGSLRLSYEGVTGAVTVDMTSIANSNLEDDHLKQMLIDHLASEDFFFVKLFKEAVFHIDSVTINRTVLSAPNSIIKGVLEMRGVKKSMQFTATLSNTTQPEILTVNTHIFVDRTEWGAKYGSSRFYKFLGKHLVFDGVTIELRLVLSKVLD